MSPTTTDFTIEFGLFTFSFFSAGLNTLKCRIVCWVPTLFIKAVICYITSASKSSRTTEGLNTFHHQLMQYEILYPIFGLYNCNCHFVQKIHWIICTDDYNGAKLNTKLVISCDTCAVWLFGLYELMNGGKSLPHCWKIKELCLFNKGG